jgi:hypothetical protein
MDTDFFFVVTARWTLLPILLNCIITKITWLVYVKMNSLDYVVKSFCVLVRGAEGGGQFESPFTAYADVT